MKVIRGQNKDAWISLDRESNYNRRDIDKSTIKREAQAL